jgi:hypothetical protein
MAYQSSMDDTDPATAKTDLDTPAEEIWSEEDLKAERDWDEQIERDFRAGRLDALINQAKADYAAGLIFDVPQNGLSNSS